MRRISAFKLNEEPLGLFSCFLVAINTLLKVMKEIQAYNIKSSTLIYLTSMDDDYMIAIESLFTCICLNQHSDVIFFFLMHDICLCIGGLLNFDSQKYFLCMTEFAVSTLVGDEDDSFFVQYVKRQPLMELNIYIYIYITENGFLGKSMPLRI